MPDQGIIDRHGETLLHLAGASIMHGLDNGAPLAPDATAYATDLTQQGASFVTLKKNGGLRGCIGSPQAWRPLVQDVAENAYSAAFRDVRFGPLAREEIPALTVSVALLTTPEPMAFTDEQDLVNRLQPEVDGLILEDQGRRGLFLPAVWESLPRPADFWTNLKRKAGLPPDHWSDTIQVQRFTTVKTSSDRLDDPQSIFRQ